LPAGSARRQPVQHEIKAGNVFEVASIPRQKLMRVLHRLAGQPEILNPVAVLSPGGADLGCQTAENVARRGVHHEQRLTANPKKGRKAPLTDSRLRGDLGTEPEFGDGDRRQINRLVVGERGDVGWRQETPFNVDPHARID
jgi:hypothetical protein